MPQALSICAQGPRNCPLLGSSVNSQQYLEFVIAGFHLLCAAGLRNCQNTLSRDPCSPFLMRFPLFFPDLMQFPTQLFYAQMIQITGQELAVLSAYPESQDSVCHIHLLLKCHVSL